jgi:hypothetical protein
MDLSAFGMYFGLFGYYAVQWMGHKHGVLRRIAEWTYTC